MTLVEKIHWYYRTYGLRALVVRALQKTLGMSGAPEPKSAQAPAAAVAPTIGVAAIHAASAVVRDHFPAIEPLSVYSSPGVGPRINLITDNIHPGSLFGGVGTAVILATLLARDTNAKLRVITRHKPADRGGFARLLECNGISLTSNVDFTLIGVDDPEAQLDVSEHDRFITTSWWTTTAVLRSIPAARVEYLLQEDERMFYPYGDEWLRCAELLARRDLRCIVNTDLLYRHLCGSGLGHLAEHAVVFEPAFPESMFHREERPAGRKRRLFFYARPNNERNLFHRGLEVLDQAVAEGLFPPTEWEMVFAGSPLEPISLGGLVKPTMLGNLGWREYGELVRGVDLGVSLMATPHPSYPPLDLAASGAAVLTNRFGLKQDLSEYSPNIVCADLDTASLLQGLRVARELALDDDARRVGYARNRLQRSWEVSLRNVLTTIREPR